MKRFAVTILYEAPPKTHTDDEKARVLGVVQAFLMEAGYKLKLVQLETMEADGETSSAKWTP